MRDYILTDNDRKIIKEYLESEKKLEGFKVLLFRARKHKPQQVIEDEELIKQFLAKVEGKQL
jgi:hypothetical protein